MCVSVWVSDQGENGEAGRVHLCTPRGDRLGTEVRVLKRGTGEKERRDVGIGGLGEREREGKDKRAREREREETGVADREIAETRAEERNLSVPRQ